MRYQAAMYVETVPNRGSPPAILLRESYREGKSVRKRTLLNLSNWSAEHIEGLRGVLKGGIVVPAGREAFAVQRSLPHGHVAAALGMARAIGLDRLLGPKNKREPNRPRDLVLAMIVSRIIAPAPSWRPPKRSIRPPRPRAWASNSGWARWARANSTRRSIGCMNARAPSRPRSPSAI
jgi:hypothetical protein